MRVFFHVEFYLLSPRITDSLEANSCPMARIVWWTSISSKESSPSKLRSCSEERQWNRFSTAWTAWTEILQRLPFLMRKGLQSSACLSHLASPKVPSCRMKEMLCHQWCHGLRNEHHKTPTVPGTSQSHDESQYIPMNPRGNRNRVALWQRWRWKVILSKATPSMASRKRMVKLGGGKNSAAGHDRMTTVYSSLWSSHAGEGE